jgi:sugar lactone lactonase YvrE
MRLKFFGFALTLAAAVSVAACSSSSTSPPPPPMPQNLYAVDLTTGKIFVYALPASAAAVPSVTVSTGFTILYDAVFDASGTLFVDDDHTPAVLHGYALPLTAASVPITNITLTGAAPTNTSNAFSFAFDPSGNLWTGDEHNNRLLGYHGPFSGTMTPAAFTTIAITSPWNVISDSSGDLYVTENDHVVRLNAPPTAINANLSTLAEPIAMLLDGTGNLYVGDFSNGNLYRYNAPINDGASPAITDLQVNTTLQTPYYMALDRSGNLYVSDCSSSVKVFATGTFSSTSAPSYTLPLPAGATCSTGLAIR